MSKYLDKIIKIKTKESLMNRLESLRIKNYKHIGDSYIGFDKLENLNILVGQNNIGKSTLLQSIEMLISEDVTNRELSTDTMLEFGFAQQKPKSKMYSGKIRLEVKLVLIILHLGQNISMNTYHLNISLLKQLARSKLHYQIYREFLKLKSLLIKE